MLNGLRIEIEFFFKFREKEILLLRKIRENMKMLVLSQL